MELIISKPEERVQKTVTWISCQTTDGHITIQEGHAPLVALIQPDSDLVIGHSAERTETIKLPHGYMVVKPTQVLIVVA